LKTYEQLKSELSEKNVAFDEIKHVSFNFFKFELRTSTFKLNVSSCWLACV